MENVTQMIHLKDVQRQCGISRSTVARLRKMPGFPAFKIGKRVVVDPVKLDEWIKKGGKVNENCGFPVDG